MADQYQKPYLDSSVFIAWIKGEIVETVDRKRIVQHLFSLADQNEFQIYTSAITLAEVHKMKRKPEAVSLSEQEDDDLLRFFENEFIVIIEVDRNISEHANRLARIHGLLPMDAIHLASALRAGCDVLLAWDDRVTRVGATQPKIRVEQPQIIGQEHMNLEGQS